MINGENSNEIYKRRYWRSLGSIAQSLEALLQKTFEGHARIDRISARAKSPDRFAVKAAKIAPNGSPKYSSPLDQIQDQIGARIVVFYIQDVPRVSDVVHQYFRAIETRDVKEEDSWRFGYAGKHFILALPTEAIPEQFTTADAPEFFELQIKTLWQHAWSEANHDLGYKPEHPLNADQERRLAFTSAQAWGADRIFDELLSELATPSAA